MIELKLRNHDGRGVNAHRLTIGRLRVWFSYAEPIAFQLRSDDDGYTVRNQWGPTTGRHLAVARGEIGGTTTQLEPGPFAEALHRAVVSAVSRWSAPSPPDASPVVPVAPAADHE